MIKISRSEDSFIFDGHATEVICAAVSSIMYTTINAILSYHEDAIEVDDNEKTDIVTITILFEDGIIKLLLDNMYDLLKELSEDYPEHIEIKEL